MKISIVTMICASCLVSCGAEVDSGHNVSKRKERREAEREAQNLEGSSRVGSGSCFGAAEELPSELASFCESAHERQAPGYEGLIETLCEERKMVNLFRPECAWDGEGGQQAQKAHMHVLDSTPLDDPGTDYYYLVAYSMKPPASRLHLIDTLFHAHGDAEGFQAEGYKLPKSTTIVPDPNNPSERVEGDTRYLNYIMTVNSNVGATRFRAEMKAYLASDNLAVVFDHATGIFEGIKMRRNLTFAKLLDDDRCVIVVLEERIVPDRGLHDIARSVLLKNDLTRMGLFYENAALEYNR